jgi:hypothetical protein
MRDFAGMSVIFRQEFRREGPLLIAAVFATLFAQHSALTGLAALPVLPVCGWS